MPAPIFRLTPRSLYPRIRYGAPAVTLDVTGPVPSFQPGSGVQRGVNVAGGGQSEYLYGRLEEVMAAELLCETDLIMEFRRFFETVAGPGQSFQFWLDRFQGSCWTFDGSLLDQNGLRLALHGGGSESYAATSQGRGLVLGSGQYLSCLLAQASAATPTGYDDPLDKAEGIVVVDFVSGFNPGDSLNHFLLDVVSAADSNRLRLYKDSANNLVFEITDSAGDPKWKYGPASWASGQRVTVVARWKTDGTLHAWASIAGGAFGALPTAGGPGTGILSVLPTTVLVGTDKTLTSPGPGTYDLLAFCKKAWDDPAPTGTLAAYVPWWRNHFPTAELMDVGFAPPRLAPGRQIWRWPLRLRQASPAFSPDQIAGLEFWGAASALALAHDDPVASLTDLSGKGRHAVQATAGKKPLFKTAVQNGYPGILFDGTDDCLVAPSVPVGAFTAIVVTNLTAAGILVEHGTGANPSSALLGTTGDTVQVARGGPVVSGKDLSANWATGAAKISVHRYNGTHASHVLRVNGAPQTLTNGAGTADPGTAVLTAALNLGARNDGASLPSAGHLFEVLVYGRALADAEARQVENALATKYGITLT